MNIKKIKEISNYRNLSGKSLVFDKSLNFIIGENNIGKTNILELLNSILATGKFVETDFYNAAKPIKITFTIEYDDASIGFFEDNFDVDTGNSITLIAEQEIIDGRISYYHATPNMTPIKYSTIRRINTLYYYAQRMPSREIGFKKNKESGKILNYIINKSLRTAEIEECDVINRDNIENVITEINHSINGINTITGDTINAYFNSEVENIVSRLLMLGDENRREFADLGEGIQYAFNIILQILEIIHRTKVSSNKEAFSERLIHDSGKMYFPLILLFDEPEIHQHPYRQRNLIKKIEGLLNNKNQEFTGLLKDIFDVDGLRGQIFIATHSPNTLLNDYKQFIRIYKEKELQIICGQNIDLGNKLYKHLLHNYIYLKEAMFSKCIIFVEGDTENGALPVFAEKKNFDLDEHGIGVIKLDGADSIVHCMNLYQAFGIRTYAVIDRDKKDKYDEVQGVFFTEEIDYEAEVYASFKLNDYLACCKEMDIIQTMIGPIKNIVPTLDIKEFKDNPEILQVTEEEGKTLMEECKTEQLKKLRDSKNAFRGALLATYVTAIPAVFNELIDLLNKGA